MPTLKLVSGLLVAPTREVAGELTYSHLGYSLKTMNDVFLVVLGAVLALITSFSVEAYKNWQEVKDKKENLKIILRLELKNVIFIVDKLLDIYGNKHYFEFKTLDQLNYSLGRLEKIRDGIIYLKDDAQKDKVLLYLNLLSIFHSDVRSLENYAFGQSNTTGTGQGGVTTWDSDYCKGERQILSLRTIDIKRSAQDIVNDFER